MAEKEEVMEEMSFAQEVEIPLETSLDMTGIMGRIMDVLCIQIGELKEEISNAKLQK